MSHDILWFFGFVILWYSLMRYILPALGIPTCMTGACQIKKEEKSKSNVSE